MRNAKSMKPAARARRKPAAPEAADHKPAKPQAPTPDWVKETPDDNDYALIMWGTDGGEEQGVSMTRLEFLALKRWLAALRGYDFTAPMDSWDTFALRDKPEAERIAKQLEITQQEIGMAMDLERVADAIALNFRRRLQRGATVEAGEFQLSDRGGSPIEQYEAEGLSGLDRCGISISVRKAEGASATGAQ